MEWVETPQHPQAIEAGAMGGKTGARRRPTDRGGNRDQPQKLPARPNLGTDGRMHYEIPAAITLVDILDGEATRRLTAGAVSSSRDASWHTCHRTVRMAVDIRLRMQHMREKIVAIPGFDGEVLRGGWSPD